MLKIIYYLWFVPVRCLGRLLGRDPLLLRSKPKNDSYWVPIALAPGTASYLSPADPSPLRGGMRGWVKPVLSLFGSKKPNAPAIAAREKDIPDEIYTLW